MAAMRQTGTMSTFLLGNNVNEIYVNVTLKKNFLRKTHTHTQNKNSNSKFNKRYKNICKKSITIWKI